MEDTVATSRKSKIVLESAIASTSEFDSNNYDIIVSTINEIMRMPSFNNSEIRNTNKT